MQIAYKSHTREHPEPSLRTFNSASHIAELRCRGSPTAETAGDLRWTASLCVVSPQTPELYPQCCYANLQSKLHSLSTQPYTQ